MQPRHITPDVSDEDRGVSPAGSNRASRRRSTRGERATPPTRSTMLTDFATACDQCRRTKSKCERSDLDNVCRACAAMGVCKYTAPRFTFSDAHRFPQRAPLPVPAISVVPQRATSSPSSGAFTRLKRCSAPSSAQTTPAHAASSTTSRATSSLRTSSAESRSGPLAPADVSNNRESTLTQTPPSGSC